MSRRFKIFAVFFILVFPSGVYVFLTAGKEKAFAHIPYYGPKPWVKVKVDGKITTDTLYYNIPGFSFYNQEGKVFNNKSFRNKVWVAEFTSLSDKNAPALAVTMNRVEERTNLDTGLRMVTFTLDSETAASMQNYAKMVHVASKRRIFLSGNKAELNNLATEGFYKPIDSAGKSITNFFLIDKEGHIRGIYNGTHVKDVDYLIDDIHELEAAYYIQHEKEHKDEHDDDAM